MRLGLGLGLDKQGSVILKPTNVFRDAALALSLRDLGLGATNIVKVRRSSDNQEQDFTATEITDGTLESFVGVGNDGFVSVWYSQTNGLNPSQNAASSQPSIVTNGVLNTENGKPTIIFDGVDDYLTLGLGNSLTYNSEISLFRVLNSSATGSVRICSDDKVGVQGYFIDYFSVFPETLRINDGSGYKTSTSSSDIVRTNQQLLYSTIFEGNTRDVYYKSNNNTLQDTITSFTPPIDSSGEAGFAIGSGADGGQNFNGNIQELIIFPNSKLSQRADLESNINNHYGIY